VAPSSSVIASELSARSKELARIIKAVGPPPVRKAVRVDRRYERVATAILHQQLAGVAAATITKRVVDLVEGSFTPERIAALREGDLRGCGVSGAKAAALFDLSQRSLDGRLDFSSMGRKSNEVVLAELVSTRGIGEWTAQMFLMGALGRADIWPTGDLGVRSGWAIIHRLDDAPTAKQLEPLANHLSPYRSDVAWYCWRAVDLERAGAVPR